MTPELLTGLAAERNTRLGASDAAAALGISPYKTPWELAAEKRGLLEPWGGNAATRHGNRLEGAILDEAEERLGPLERNVLLWAPQAGFPLAATCDGIVADTKSPVEAKTSGITGPVYGNWGDDSTDEVPDHYLLQLVVQMHCAEQALAAVVDVGHLFALLGGRGIVAYRVAHDRQLAAEIVGRLRHWWQRHVVDGIEPEHSTAPPLEVVKRLRREPAKVIQLNSGALAAVAEWEAAKEAKRVTEAAVEEKQSALLLLLGDAEAANLSDGRRLTFFETKRQGYTVGDSSFRTLRITKSK